MPTPSRRAPPASRVINGRSARDHILDAAEELFAERGYTGASVRDITGAAGVDLSLMNYHFGSKFELMRSVLARRASAYAAVMIDRLEAQMARVGGRSASAEQIFYAFAVDGLVFLAGSEPGWRNYTRLIARLGQVEHVAQAESLMAIEYARVFDLYVAALASSYPAAPREAIHASLHYLEMMMRSLHASHDPRSISADASTRVGAETEAWRIARFTASGFSGLVDAGPVEGRPVALFAPDAALEV